MVQRARDREIETGGGQQDFEHVAHEVVRVVKAMPVTGTDKIAKSPLRREAWLTRGRPVVATERSVGVLET